MQQHVGQVMAPRPQTEQLAVHHMGQHRQRLPIARINIRVEESPFYTIQGQSVLNMNVRGDDKIVIVVDEVTSRRRPVKGNRHQRQQHGRQPRREVRPGHDRSGSPRWVGLGIRR